MLASAAADRMLSAASCRNTVLRVAASSSLSGGTSRVFVLPGIDALAMTAIAQVERKCQSDKCQSDKCQSDKCQSDNWRSDLRASPSPMHASSSLWHGPPRRCGGSGHLLLTARRRGDRRLAG